MVVPSLLLVIANRLAEFWNQRFNVCFRPFTAMIQTAGTSLRRTARR
jgi:hypothetical protein